MTHATRRYPEPEDGVFVPKGRTPAPGKEPDAPRTPGLPSAGRLPGPGAFQVPPSQPEGLVLPRPSLSVAISEERLVPCLWSVGSFAQRPGSQPRHRKELFGAEPTVQELFSPLCVAALVLMPWRATALAEAESDLSQGGRNPRTRVQLCRGPRSRPFRPPAQ